ncbi:DUF6773 family protein [Halalkalibacter krulwichiae]|uniref:DUF3278 domain-containing protein n=1 Tax=Halalkalibacter krulwichiae TaxID=199441 RepID=A0A1X9MGD6_9BACI|nr:DUF6773 family protein [Halalkalibacter krulwichiae]ARK29502.1 hypothetical protein BkAM31D_06315 [Halalkalibacter krulwichiae]
MNIFRKNKIQDERIIHSRNQIYKEVYYLVMAICILSVALKYGIYGPNVELVITELAILILAGIYYTVRTVQLGIYADEVELHDRSNKWSMKSKSFLLSFGFGVAISLYFGVRSSILYGDESTHIWFFLSVFVASLMIYVPILLLLFFGGHAFFEKWSKNRQKSDSQ